MNGAAYDPNTALVNDVSNKPGTALSGTTANNGEWVDCGDGQGPVHGNFAVGDATGSPTAYTVTCKLQEADDSSGTGAQDIPVQDSALVLSSNASSGFVRGRRTKRYVRCVMTPAFTGGSSPTAPVASVVSTQKIHA